MEEKLQRIADRYQKYLRGYCQYVSSEFVDERIVQIGLDELYCKQDILISTDDFNLPDNLSSFGISSFMEFLENHVLSGNSSGLGSSTVDHEQNTQKQFNPLEKSYILVVARPGEGKTTFCKKFCMVCLDDRPQKASRLQELTNINFNTEVLFPVFLPCRNLSETIFDCNAPDFETVAYDISINLFQSYFQEEVTEADFSEMIRSKAEQQELILIVDGWDELVKEDQRQCFSKLLAAFIGKNRYSYVIITSRPTVDVKKELSEYQLAPLAKIAIQPFSTTSIRAFCLKWHEAVFKGAPSRIQNYKRIISQLESAEYSSIRYMASSPYLLSNLLRLSIFTGKLPSSIAELYNRTFAMMLDWTLEIEADLIEEDVIIQLVYIASAMTKLKKYYIDKHELVTLLDQCFEELDGFFQRPICSEDIPQYATAFVTRNCVLVGLGRDTYSFPHRQMQDYLTAYAIVNNYSSKEDNSKETKEVLQWYSPINQKNSSWPEIVMFCTMLGSRNHASAIIHDLLESAKVCKINKNEAYIAINDCLFSLFANGVIMSAQDKRDIFDCCLKEEISTAQVSALCRITSSHSPAYLDIRKYIVDQIKKSMPSLDIYYPFAWGIIAAQESVLNHNNPYQNAVSLAQKDDAFSRVTGLLIIEMMAWCKQTETAYENYSEYCENLNESDCKKLIKIFNSLLSESISSESFESFEPLLRMLKQCVISGFIDYHSVNEAIPNTVIDHLFNQDKMENSKASYRLLDIYPLIHHEDLGNIKRLGSTNFRLKLLREFEQSLERNSTVIDGPVFAFNRCLAVGGWSDAKSVEAAFDKMCISEEGQDSESRARRKQIEDMLGYYFAIIIGRHEKQYLHIEESKDISSRSISGLQVMDLRLILNGVDNGTFRIDPELLQYNSLVFNNLAYLLRRKEIRCWLMSEGTKTELYIKSFLSPFTDTTELFFVINRVLEESGFYRNNLGSFDRGLILLRNKLPFSLDSLEKVISWWRDVAVFDEETEGIVVLLWLYHLGFIRVKTFRQEDTAIYYNPNEFVQLVISFDEQINSLGKTAQEIKEQIICECRSEDEDIGQLLKHYEDN